MAEAGCWTVMAGESPRRSTGRSTGRMHYRWRPRPVDRAAPGRRRTATYTRRPMGSSARSSRRIRVGVAGLGAVAQAVHLPLLARLPDEFEIAALADLSPSLRDAMGLRYGVAAAARVGSVAELLDVPDLDGLILLTSGSHGADALAAIDRDLPVLCEKPLAFTVAEADRLAASPGADRLLLGYMKTFDPAVLEAGRLIADPTT